MANPTCTKEQLIREGACYGSCSLDAHEQLALEVYARMQTVRAIGGTNYIGDEDQLARDAMDVFGGVEQDQQRDMHLAILLNNADASGAAISADPDTLQGFIVVLNAYNEAELTRMNLLLQCKMGASKAYPQ